MTVRDRESLASLEQRIIDFVALNGTVRGPDDVIRALGVRRADGLRAFRVLKAAGLIRRAPGAALRGGFVAGVRTVVDGQT